MISRIREHKFDLEKKVILCGKGETASLAPHAVDNNCYVACLNTTANLFSKVDFLFFNDIETLYKIENTKEKFEKIENIVIPIQLHSKERVSNLTFKDVVEKLNSYNLGIYTYRLHTQNIKNPQGETDCFGFGPEPIYSTYHSALYWLTTCGFNTFEIYGVSKTGKYDVLFEKNNDAGNKRNLTWYNTNYRIGLSILHRNNCKYEIK